MDLIKMTSVGKQGKCSRCGQEKIIVYNRVDPYSYQETNYCKACVSVDNATLSMVEKEFGDLEEGNITHGTVKVLAAGAVLKPQYGDSPQYYSASIPFIADSIVLRANQPFVAVYLVSALVQLPEPVIKIQN